MTDGGSMRALWLENQQLTIRDVDVPSGADEAVVRIRLSGICGTDLELTRGYYPYTGVLGHEFVGEVVESPDTEWVVSGGVCGTRRGSGRCAG